jgi:hypothetical protein
MPESSSYASRFLKKECRETARFTQHKLLTGVAVGTAVVIMRLALWHFRQITLTWAEVWINLLIVAGSSVIVLLGAFVVNLFRVPVLLDAERADEIAKLNARLKIAEPLNTQKEISITFRKLMEEGRNIKERIITNQKAHELTAVTQQLNDWIKHTERAFIESDLHTDASAFVHSGERPSDEQMKASIPSYIQKQTWKHYDLARVSIYVEKLEEIVARRGL